MAHARSEDRKAYAAARRARVRQELADRLGGKCDVCGSAEGLMFSHRDLSGKSFMIDGNLGRPRNVLEAEADKCRLLCGEHYRPPYHQGTPRGPRTRYRGEDSPNALLSENEARAIKYSKEPGKVLADRYEIATSTVSEIRNGKRWKHI